MRFRFSPLTTFICLFLAIGMLALSRWQWTRHLEKQSLIQELQATLKRDPIELLELISPDTAWASQTWRRVHFSGTFDFEHETIVRRNRGASDQAGFHVITPLVLDNSDQHILVDRGFLPLGREARDFRKKYQNQPHIDGYGLVKQSMPQKFLAPNDPPSGLGMPWVDIWIRVDIEKMRQQLPYPVLPVYLEIMEHPDDPLLASKIVKEGSAGRNDVLALTGQQRVNNFGMDSPEEKYPLPLFDTTPPPDIHLGYVWEWAFMALLTVGIGLVAQLKRRE